MTTLWIAIALIAFVTYLLVHGSGKKGAAVELAPNYRSILDEKVVFYKKLGVEDKQRFAGMVDDFLGYVHIEGVGVELDETDRVLVAASAIIPAFGFPGWKYRNLSSVVLYPDTFDKNYQFDGENRNIMGMVGTGPMNGQMLLSRAALHAGFSKNSGSHNTGIHEFVHLLDKSDGATDGIPENLMAHEYATPWLKLIHHEMHRIAAGTSEIDPYAITNEAEFLAVASEYFFTKPDKLKAHHPDLYRMLARIFIQHPAENNE